MYLWCLYFDWLVILCMLATIPSVPGVTAEATTAETIAATTTTAADTTAYGAAVTSTDKTISAGESLSYFPACGNWPRPYWTVILHSRSASRVTTNCEIERSIEIIPLCYFRHLSEMLKVSRKIPPKVANEVAKGKKKSKKLHVS